MSANKYWQTKVSALQILRNFSVLNIFILDDEQKAAFKSIIIGSLVDENFEVRLAACLTLTAFVHSAFVHVDNDLIVNLLF